MHKRDFMHLKTVGVIILFKKRRGIHIPYNKQGLIYFTCMNVKDMPEEIQRKILNLCIEVCDEHYKALYAALTDDTKNIHSISMEFHVSETQLYYYRKKFYEKW